MFENSCNTAILPQYSIRLTSRFVLLTGDDSSNNDLMQRKKGRNVCLESAKVIIYISRQINLESVRQHGHT